MGLTTRVIKRLINEVLASALIFIGIGLSNSALAQNKTAANSSDDGLTLPLAIEIALRTNPLVQATNNGRALTDAQLQEATAARLPQLQITENFTYGNNPVFVFGSLLEQGRFGPQNFALPALNNPASIGNFRTGVILRIPLFDQRQSATRIAQARIKQHQADTQITQVQQRIRFEVLQAYFAVLLAQAHKAVAEESVKLGEAVVKLSRDRVAAGTVVTSDPLSAEVQLAEFRQQQIQAEGDILTAQAALNTALGLPINTPHKVNGALIEKAFDLEGSDELMRTALKNRPDLSRAALSVDSSTKQIRAVHGEWLPRVDVFSSFGASNKSFGTGSTDYAVGASVTFNLFDAGRNARIKQAELAQSLAANEQQHLTNQIQFEVVRAYQQFISARERTVVASRVISHATEALRIVQDRYQEGLTTITEVLRAETALAKARMNLLGARYDYYIGYANVLLTTGQLNDVQPFVS